MRAKQCDRCGAFFNNNLENMNCKLQLLQGKSNRYTRYTKSIDLCPDCDKALLEWFEEKEHEQTITSRDSKAFKHLESNENNP